MIPKIIHYCWFGGNPKPNDVRHYIDSWRKHCPDYEIKEWNESNFDIAENNYCKEAYDAKKWAFVTDYVRLKALFEEGGFYMDTDVEVLKSLDPLRKYNAVSGYESQKNIPTGTMGACRHNEWIGMLLHNYDNRHFIMENGQYDLTTNVAVISKLTVQKYHIELTGDITFFGKNMVILPFDYLCAKYYETGEVNPTKNTYTIHHFAGSWWDANVREYEEAKRKYFSKYHNLLPYTFSYNLAKVLGAYETGGMQGLMKRFFNKLKKG